jgi:hypothetical protein
MIHCFPIETRIIEPILPQKHTEVNNGSPSLEKKTLSGIDSYAIIQQYVRHTEAGRETFEFQCPAPQTERREAYHGKRTETPNSQ